MAIAARGTPTNGHKQNAGTLTISLPTGVVSGDVIVFNVIVGGTTLPATPTGLTLIDSGNAGPSYATYYRVCNGTEGASFSWTVASSASGTCRAYSGVDNGAPINAHSVLRTATSLTATATGITTTFNGCQLIFGSGIASAETSFTNPTGFSAQDINTSSPAAVSCDESQTTAGATGNQSGTWASTANNNYASLVALKPAASGVANTLTASPGAMVITGDAVTPPVAHTPTASPAAMAISGAPVTPPVKHSPSASPGAMTITGAASTLPVAHKPIVSPATVAISGSATTLPVKHSPTLSPAAYTITGDAATLVGPAGGIHYALTASPGSVTITGAATLVPVRKVLAIATGSIVVTGNLANLPVKRTIVASPGALVITGFTAGQPAAKAGADDDMWYMWANAVRQARVVEQPQVEKEPVAWWSISLDVGEDEELQELVALGLL